jgi:predicted RND superfamily exporter protein
MQAVTDAASKRFRAILLTSLTTFFGLVPIVLETSLQAQIVIPMAASLAFGILFATVITLFLIPCLYIVLDDFGRWWREAWSHILPKRAGKAGLHPGIVHSETKLAADPPES